MAKRSQKTLFATTAPIKESAMEKTSRLAGEILEEETQKRLLKTARLREARLERERGTLVEDAKPKAKGTNKKPRTGAAGRT